MKKKKKEALTIEKVRNILATSRVFYILDFVMEQMSPNKRLLDLKERGFCSSSPLFPLFIDSEKVSFRLHCHTKRKIDQKCLIKCLHSGATVDGLFGSLPCMKYKRMPTFEMTLKMLLTMK